MAEVGTQSIHRLLLRRKFDVARKAVFDAWTNAEQISRWFAPSDDYETFIAEIDFRIGGAYRIGMRHKAKGIEHIAHGVYREIVVPERLVFTWSWEEAPGSPETLVTVVFRENAGATELTLTHELFPDQKSMQAHEQGWIGSIGRLAQVLG